MWRAPVDWFESMLAPTDEIAESFENAAKILADHATQQDVGYIESVLKDAESMLEIVDSPDFMARLEGSVKTMSARDYSAVLRAAHSFLTFVAGRVAASEQSRQRHDDFLFPEIGNAIREDDPKMIKSAVARYKEFSEAGNETLATIETGLEQAVNVFLAVAENVYNNLMTGR
jgi:ribosomal 50S subunit-associated protein YjgA (DUF615 family)